MILRKIPVQEGEKYYDYGVYCGKYEYISKCDVCGQEFQHESRNSMYCSKRCADIANIQSRKAYRHETCLKTCEHCGEQFQASRIDSLYCSDACRQANHRDKQKREEPAEQTDLYVVPWEYNTSEFAEKMSDNGIKYVIDCYYQLSESRLRKFTQKNVKYVYIDGLQVPWKLYWSFHEKEITQADYESKYKKYLQGLKIGDLGIEKTAKVAVNFPPVGSHNAYNEKCYNAILPEFIKKIVGRKKIVQIG